jgi:uncharacterized protein YjiK
MEARGQLQEVIPRALLGLTLLFTADGISAARPPGYSDDIREVRGLDADERNELAQRSADLPLGFEYFFRLEGRSETDTSALGEPARGPTGLGQVGPVTVDPLNMAFDGKRRRLFVIEEGTHEILGLSVGADGLVDSQQITPAVRLGADLATPRGMTLDQERGRLFVLASAASKILEIELESGLDSRVVSLSDLASFESGEAAFRGLAFNSADGHLYLLGSGGNALYEITDSGRFVALHDVSPFGLSDPSGILFAPTSDRTDDPSATHLFFASAGLDGQVREFALRSSLGPRLREIRRETRLVQTIRMPRSTRSAPELAGVTYLQSVGTLLASDSEVDQTSHSAANNLFEMTLLGALVDTLSSTGFSHRPTGVTYNPGNNHLFFSDASADEIFELDPGSDGLYDTEDDTVTSFDTRVFESFDPEGIAFDSWTGALFVVDGVNSEVYRIGSGPNGVFDGLAPAGDDQVTSFDTASLGVSNPEGIAFDHDSGNLYIIGRPPAHVAEVTTSGILVRRLGVSAVGVRRPVGLTLAPSTVAAGIMNLYIADRGPGGDDGSGESGRIHELALPEAASDDGASQDPSGSVGVAPGLSGAASAAQTVTEIRVSDDSDDAEESAAGNVDLRSGDLDLGTATVGLRFTPVDVPQGAVITSAHVRFQADESDSNGTSLTVEGEAADDASAFIDSKEDLTSRSRTVAAVPWIAPDWSAGDAGPDQQTPDLSAVVQEIVNRPGWSSGNAMVILVSGSGTRVAESHDANPDAAAVLHVEYEPPNRPPEANDDNTSTAENSAVTIDVTVNDTDPDGNLDVTTTNTACPSCALPANGSLIDSGGGTFEYTPNTSFVGSDSFVYEICDSDSPSLCDTATVTIVVGGAAVIEVRVAADSDDAEEFASGNMDLVSSDLDIGGRAIGLRFASLNIPPGAVIAYSYVEFQADESDSTETSLMIEGEAIDDAPTFTDSSQDITSRARTTAAVSWSPPEWSVGDAGPDQRTPDLSAVIQEIVSRPGWSSGNAIVIIVGGSGMRVAESHDVLPAAAALLHVEFGVSDNAPPMASDDSASTVEDTAVTIDVAVNDTDPDGNLDPATTKVTCPSCLAPANGSLVNNGDGSFEYTPNPNFNGLDIFVYEICDSGFLSLCDTATVSVVVDGMNDPPVANDDSASSPEDTTVTIDVAANDTDPEDNLIAATVNATCPSCTLPLNGSLVNNGDGSFDYTPNPGFRGSESFVYEICDSGTPNLCDTATVSIVVAAGANVLVGAGDISECTSDFDEATAQLLDNIPGTVITMGDNVYPDGSDEDFANCYEPTWGRHKERTKPSVGNHEYHLPGATGYFNYFGEAAGTPGEGYYSYDVAGWHIIVLNSNCGDVSCGRNSPQGQWLQADLAANPATCTLAYFHRPRFSSGEHGNGDSVADFWEILYEAGADVVLAGHDHNYERFALQDPNGVADPVRGIRSFVVGTGGRSNDPIVDLQPNSEVANGDTYGVIKLTLHPTSYDWEFIPIAGSTFTDSGTSSCVEPDNGPPVASDDSASTSEDTPVTIDVAANDTDPNFNLDVSTANTACPSCTLPANGSLVNNGDGTFDYTPNPDFDGSDDFVYEICDLGDPSLCDAATVTITISGTNDPPVANDDIASTDEDTALTIDVTANDSDPEGNLDLATVDTGCPSCTLPASGSLVNSGDGTFTYTPDPDFNGSDGFVYEICDSDSPSWCDTATVSITVTGVDDSPVANDDSALTSEDTPVTIDVAANDTDADGDLDVSTVNTTCPSCALPGSGSLINKGDGTFDYTPDPSFDGSDSFVYEICDGGSPRLCSTATVSITVTGINDPPLANNDSASTDEDTAVTLDVASNDTDPDDNLDVSTANTACPSCAPPGNGTLVNNGNGTFNYTPDSNFNGSDSLVYEICDSGSPSFCDTATVSITVSGVDDPPVAFDDSTSTPEGIPVTIDAVANDTDPDGDLDASTANTACPSCLLPSNGSLVDNGGGSFEYTPNPGFAGIDSFVYEVCDSGSSSLCDTATVSITVIGDNNPPVANDDSASTIEGISVVIDVAANDTDMDGDLDVPTANTACSGCTLPSNGSLLNNGDGTFDYAPNPSFVGTDSFVYEICDSGSPSLCDIGTVTVVVSGVTVIEVRVGAGSDDAEESRTGAVELASSDLDLGSKVVGIRFSSVDIPQGAAVTKTWVQFQADESDSGESSLIVEGEAIDDAPTFTDTDEDISSRARTAAAVSWNPPEWSAGDAGAEQQTSDLSAVVQEIVNRPGWSSGNAMVIIISGAGPRAAECFESLAAGAPLLHVEYGVSGNGRPVANDDSASTSEGVSVTIDVAANDTDPESNLDVATANTSCASCAFPGNGSLINNGDGTFDYTPDAGFSGTDSFVYEICDAGSPSLCDTATVSITVSSTNLPPVANDDSASAAVDTTVTINVAANDTDPEGNLDVGTANTACPGCAPPNYGTLVANGDGTFDYTPDAGFSGTDSFVYEICDVGSPILCDTAAVTVLVGGSTVIDVRVAADSDDAEEGGTGSMQLTSSDLDLGSSKVVGLRFAGLSIPQGAAITEAWVQFQADEGDSGESSMTVEGEAIDDAPTFSDADQDITARTRTAATVSWSPAGWSTGDAGAEQQTSDISAVVQEIVNRPGWSSGNALVIIVSGAGMRVAESFDGLPEGAPLLHVEYGLSDNDPPVANDDSASTAEDTTVTIDVAANDTDPDGNLDPTTANASCPSCTLPVNGSLVTSTSLARTALFMRSAIPAVPASAIPPRSRLR